MSAQTARQRTFIKKMEKVYKKIFFDNSNSLLLLYGGESKRIIIAHFAKVCVYEE